MKTKPDFDTIFKEFHPKILHYVSRLAGSLDAEDITQEVFEKVSRGLEDFKGESQLSTWLYRIATNTALDRIKSRQFSRQDKEAALEGRSDVEDKDLWTGQKKRPIDHELIRKEMSECVKEFVHMLPADYQSVILLSELEGFKNREIADILHISLEAVKIRLHRARARLKELLDQGCDFYHDEQSILACDRKPPLIQIKKSD
jgi:RNA polymerase sigma-70 factor (ECF subfamily)